MNQPVNPYRAQSIRAMIKDLEPYHPTRVRLQRELDTLTGVRRAPKPKAKAAPKRAVTAAELRRELEANARRLDALTRRRVQAEPARPRVTAEEKRRIDLAFDRVEASDVHSIGPKMVLGGFPEPGARTAPRRSTTSKLPEGDRAEIDRAFGVRAKGDGVRREGNKLILGG